MASLTTIATPHLGLQLIDNIRNSSEKLNLPLLERAFGVVGLGKKNVNEFQTRNMNDFNLVAEDDPTVSYYSFGTKKREL